MGVSSDSPVRGVSAQFGRPTNLHAQLPWNVSPHSIMVTQTCVARSCSSIPPPPRPNVPPFLRPTYGLQDSSPEAVSKVPFKPLSTPRHPQASFSPGHILNTRFPSSFRILSASGTADSTTSPPPLSTVACSTGPCWPSSRRKLTPGRSKKWLPPHSSLPTAAWPLTRSVRRSGGSWWGGE